MKIISAKSKFLKPCFGTERAFKKCLKAAGKKDCAVYGELVHNRQITGLLVVVQL